MKDQLEKTFKLNKTSTNSLNFVNKDQEKGLLAKPNPDFILDVIRFTYIVLNEDFSCFEGNAIIENLFDKIYTKYNISSLSKY